MSKITIDSSVLEQALNWAADHGDKIFAAGGFPFLQSMNTWAVPLRAALDKPPVQLGGLQPDWKLVPGVPTEAMLTAGDYAFVANNGKPYFAYLAMLDAAPQPPRPTLNELKAANQLLEAQRDELLAALRKVSTCLNGWLEIADEEDQRDYDKEALAEANQVMQQVEGTPNDLCSDAELVRHSAP